ncbi:MAG TPA: lasso peptide biosynthesis B2 protein, partial [Thermoanaerobaculia bacterium]|nr:lasso peptide biosynthesis B2 protein [Thermoanaerobaculia bacterium]
TLARALDERGQSKACDVDRIVAAFASVSARHPLSTNCLHRSLALKRVLARRGAHARLRIGVRPRPELLPGHAWLELGGAVINDDAERVRGYVPLEVSESALRICYSSRTPK